MVRLPKITIPSFSGQYAEWTSFRDLFVSLVHCNKHLDNVQKLHYLKTHLTGEASQLIRHTPITGANYELCWSLLEKRYNNKRYLADQILKRFFAQKCITTESARGLKELLDTTVDCISALTNINVNVSTWDVIVIYVVASKLDPETRKQWELHIANFDDLPTLSQFKNFLESRFRALEFVDTKKALSQHSSGTSSRPKVLMVTDNDAKSCNLKCEFCSGNHKLCFCKTFAKQECTQRREFVAKNSICFNCLGSNHSAYNCFKPTRCRICKKRHHSLLHQAPSASDNNTLGSAIKESVEEAGSSAETSPQVVSCLSARKVSSQGQVLLATALVNAESDTGTSHMVRALLDQGSQACFITEAAVQLLNLKRTHTRGTITGLGGDKSLTSRYVVTLNLKSLQEPTFEIEIKAYVLKTITSCIPENYVVPIEWAELQELSLADPQFNVPSKVDMLLGANVYSQIIREGVKKSPNGKLIAQSTTLGWILSGSVQDNNNKNSRISVMHAQVNENDFLKKFWEIEEQTNNKTILTAEEQRCEEIFTNTTERTPEGRYVVRLPFRETDCCK